MAARKHFGECARTAGEGEEGLVGKVELFETVGYNFQGLEINWGLYSAHLIHTVPELQERKGEVNDLLERWNCLALYGIILNPMYNFGLMWIIYNICRKERRAELKRPLPSVSASISSILLDELNNNDITWPCAIQEANVSQLEEVSSDKCVSY